MEKIDIVQHTVRLRSDNPIHIALGEILEALPQKDGFSTSEIERLQVAAQKLLDELNLPF